MKHVRLIRHGESAANAGEASLDHATIPLTPKGVGQASLVAGSFAKAPDLIVASPFSRAQATAMQTVAAFPSVPFEIWPIQEFTYLEPARCINTTVAQRRDWVEAYWAKADPAFTDGEGAESFLDFISRAQSFLDRLAEHPAHDIVVFSHGQCHAQAARLLSNLREHSLTRVSIHLSLVTVLVLQFFGSLCCRSSIDVIKEPFYVWKFYPSVIA